MTIVLSWLRRAGRTLRVCLASGALLIIWKFVEGVAAVPPPLTAAPLLLVFGLLFVWLHWIRPRRFKRRRGPADVRLRRLHPAMAGPLAAAIVVTCIACEAMYLLHLRFLPIPAEDPFAELVALANEPWGWLPLCLLVVVLAPVIEETVFRGWIQRPLERYWGPAPAIVVTAGLFSLVHLIPEYLPYYFAMGVVLGGFVVVTRSLWASLLLHAAFNLQSTALMFLGAGEFYNEVALAQQMPVVLSCVAVLAAAGILLTGTARRLRAASRAQPRALPLPVAPLANQLESGV